MGDFLANFIKNRLLICLFFLGFIVAGIYSFQTIPIDAFPDLTNNQVQIITEASGLPPKDIEEQVTVPIESVLNGIPKVKLVRSISKFGLSIITVVFVDEVNVYFSRQLVSERLQIARARLSAGVNPQLGPVTTGMGEIFQYFLKSKKLNLTELKTIQEWDIKHQLRTVTGVSEVNTWGGFTKDFSVRVYPEKLIQYNLSLEDVFRAIQDNNQNFGGGIVQNESEQYLVRGLGRVYTNKDIGQIIVKYQNGTPIFISTIAQVEEGKALRQGAVSKDGKGEVVIGIVMMQKGENSRNVIKRVKEKFRDIQKSLPADLKLIPFYDQTDLVENTMHTLQKNLLEGGLLVVAVLLLMLGHLRAAILVALTIPVSLMFSFVGMRYFGISANIMSLGAVDFGMIVDGSIVMAENILKRLSEDGNDENKTTFSIIQEAVKEMARPITFGILIITIVYIPILSLEGMEYKMFSPMVLTVCAALIGSLLAALLLVPVACSFMLKKGFKEKENKWLSSFSQQYSKHLQFALKNKKQVVILVVIGFVVTMFSVPFLGTEFVPKLDEGDSVIEVRNFPSVSLGQALKNSTTIEQIIKTFPQVEFVVSKTGRPDLATDPMGVYQTDVFIHYKAKAKWKQKISKEDLISQMRTALEEQMLGVNFNFTQPIAMRVDELVSGVRSDLGVKIFGDNLDELSKLANKLEKILSNVKGQSDLQVERITGSNEIVILPNRDRMALYGVNISDMKSVLEAALTGVPVSEVFEGKKRFAIRVRLAEEQSSDKEMLGRLLVINKEGVRIPLASLADIQSGQTLEVVNHEFGQRRITVQCNVKNRSLGSFVNEAQTKVKEKLVLPKGYFLQWGGQFENQQRAMSKLVLIVPISILIIFFMLASSLTSFKDALLVMICLPLSLIGGVLALWLRGMYLSVPALIGFIALFGVAVLNGLVLVSSIKKIQSQTPEMDIEEVVQEAGKARLRPILMTALVASLGFLPMALSTGTGAEVQKPLATVVIGGLITSTLLTLMILPIVYSLAYKKFKSITNLF
jgi:cobalt-zinc-cadmium resistance protein CzcA